MTGCLLHLIEAGRQGPTLDQLLSFLKSKSSHQLNNFASKLAVVLLSNRRPAATACLWPMVFGLMSHSLSGFLSNMLWTISRKLLLIKSIPKESKIWISICLFVYYYCAWFAAEIRLSINCLSSGVHFPDADMAGHVSRIC